MRVFRTSYRDKKTGETKQVKKWYIELRDHMRTTRRFPAFTDKKQSEDLGRQIERLVSYKVSGEQPDPQLSRWLEGIPDKLRDNLIRVGLIDTRRAAAGKLLRQHVDDFEQSLKAKGNTDKHTKLVISRVKAITESCKFNTWSDLSASRVQTYLVKLRNNGEGITDQTSNFYLQAIRQFAKWMVQDRRASESPLEHLKGLNVRTDRRHDRRSLEPDELRRLLETTLNGPVRVGVTGLERAMLYRIAIETGLRANELRTLKVSSFDLDNGSVMVDAAYSKHRRRDTVPIRPDTAADLQSFFGGKLPNAPAFKMPNPHRLAKVLYADLEAAEILVVDEAGRYADFHALRHTTGSLLAASGCHPKVAQSIMAA